MDGMRALIMDDSSVMRRIVERSLWEAGINLAHVFEAGNGAGALSLLRN
jgi:two-component system, chemotaxis family, chemotaxis protein CheY